MKKALLWKDSRIFLDVFLAGVALLFASYALAFLLVYSEGWGAFRWSKVIAGGASLTRFSSLLVSALFGAYAFGKEREDASLRFLTRLPAKRRDVVKSKIAIAVGSVAALWLISLAVLAGGVRAMGYEWGVLLLSLQAMLGYVASGVLAFGAAWLLSLFMNTTMGAAFAGLMLLAPVCACQLLANSYLGIDNPMFFHWIAVVFMVVAGASGVAAGTAVYLRHGGTPGAVRAGVLASLRGAAARSSSPALIGTKRVGPFRALLWKDYRVMKGALLIGVAAVCLPYVVALALPGGSQEMLGHLRGASLIAIALGAVIFTFWSGQVMAADAGSGAVQFVSRLPAPAPKRLHSKLAVSLVPALVLAGVNLAVLIIANNLMSGEVRFDGTLTWQGLSDAPFVSMGLALTNGTVAGFSVAWFVSARYSRPAVAIVLGVLATPVYIGLWAGLSALCAEAGDGLSPLGFAGAFGVGTSVIAVALVAGGCLAALKARTA
ncbi:MAG: ABC transporter permease [Phycisphaerae bacterium]|nr:ABC transporter permease [Phycisphaerae bacterium]